MDNTEDRNKVRGVLDQILYHWIKQGKAARRPLRGGLRLAFKPGQLTATRHGKEPSLKEIAILISSLRRAIKAAGFLNKLPAVQKSDLLHWPEFNALGYRITWEQNNNENNNATGQRGRDRSLR